LSPIGDLLGRDAVAVDHVLAVIGLRLGDAATRRHHLHAVADELERVAVAGDDRDRDLLLLCLLDEGRDDVVGLEAVDGVVRVAEGLDERAHVRVLLGEQVGLLGPVALVLGVDLLAAARPGVPDDDGRLHAVLGQQLHEHRREAEDRVRVAPVGGGDRLGEREERSVDERVAVDEEELAGQGGPEP
jgi:hypothetical protein